MQFVKIILFSVLAAVTYGVLHDLITAHVCVEYFTVAHPPIFGGTTNPIILAFSWGVIATWWVGLPLGFLLALAARVGSLPKLSARNILRPMAIGLIIVGMIAMLIGVICYNGLRISLPILDSIPPEHHRRFFFDAGAHTASYLLGALLGIVLTIWTLIKRVKLAMAAARK